MVVQSGEPLDIGPILGKFNAEANIDIRYQTHSTKRITAFQDLASNTGPLQFKIQYDHHLATQLMLTFLSLLYWQSVEESLPV
jgi:hypothetical protein